MAPHFPFDRKSAALQGVHGGTPVAFTGGSLMRLSHNGPGGKYDIKIVMSIIDCENRVRQVILRHAALPVRVPDRAARVRAKSHAARYTAHIRTR
jgi:hypothetical protein